MKKLIFLVIDGLGDEDKLFRNAKITNLNKLAQEGKTGRIIIDEAPESDAAIVRLFGYETGKGYPGRGPLEALGAGAIFSNEKKFLAWRANFVTQENKKSVFKARIKDPRVGRTLTNKHSGMLAAKINARIKNIKLIPTVEHRAVVVFKGMDFNPNITNLDPYYERKKDGTAKAVKLTNPVIKRCRAFTGSWLTAEIANEYNERVYQMLKENKIKERKKLLQATGITMRDAGNRVIKIKTTMPWTASVGMPMEKGIAMAAKMKLLKIKYPPITISEAQKKDQLYGHFFKTLKTEIKAHSKAIDTKYKAIWLHVKPTDICGHDGRIDQKKKMLEELDRTLIAKIRKKVETGKYIAVITGDHSTPCKTRKHTADPVPLLIAGKEKQGRKFYEYKKTKLAIRPTKLFARNGPVLN